VRIKSKMVNVLEHRQSGRLLAGVIILAPFLFIAIFSSYLLPFNPFESVAQPFSPPSLQHPFGVDDLGRDLYSAVLAGTQTSLKAGLLVAILSIFIGVTIGVISGFFGGLLDDVLMRLTELVQSIPRFFVAILIVALFGGSFTTLILVLGFTSWPILARITRAETLSLLSRDFVSSAVCMGCGRCWIITRHILPHAIQPILATIVLIVSGAILTEASLSYLGISDPNVVSWGRLIFNAQSFLHHAWWLSVFPGLAFTTLILAIHLIADGLRLSR